VFVGQSKSARHQILYSRRLGERFTQEIRGTDSALSPVFSPDGKDVLFALRRRDGGGIIKRINVAGGVARTLLDSGIANGQFSWREGTAILTTGAGRGIAILNAGNGTTSILALPDSVHAYGFPDVLPGGRAALITIQPTGAGIDSSVLAVVTIPGGKVTSLGMYGLSPHYSLTEGGQIVFATASQLLETVPFDARALRVTGSPAVLARDVGGGSGGAVPFAVADDGTLAFIQGRTSLNGHLQPVVVNRVGARRFIGAAAGVYGGPRVSPDGNQFAVVVGRALNGGEILSPDIWRINVSTGQASRVTTNQSSASPVWSRDGTEIYFSRSPLDPSQYAVALTADAQPRIAFRAPGRQLLTSDVGPAHGYAVVAVTGPASADLWITPMDSLDKPVVFAAGPYIESLPRLSPDGRFVAYESGRTGTYEIYVRPIDRSGEEVRISTGGGIDPVWSRDGHELFFIAGKGAGEVAGEAATQLVAAQVTTSPKVAVAGVRPLFSMKQYISLVGRSSYDVFPNGEFVMLATQEADSTMSRPPLVVRTNFLSAIGETRRPP
jgi:hypothetical protein